MLFNWDHPLSLSTDIITFVFCAHVYLLIESLYTTQITNDLEYLIEKAVNTANADYAVVTGVQIHNWASDLEGDAPSMEFVAPSKVYAVVNGVKVHLDLGKVPVRLTVEGRCGALSGSFNVRIESPSSVLSF